MNLSIHAQTALSYLEDVEEAINELDREENYLIRERKAHKIISQDLSLARGEACQASEAEKPVIEAMCYFQEGMISLSIARGYNQIYAVPEGKRNTQTALANACEAFSKAINSNPKPTYYFFAGQVYGMLGRDPEAVQMYQIAASGDDPKIAIEARKEIGRIGPVSQSTSVVTNSSGGQVEFVRQKKLDWAAGIKGIIAVIIGLPLCVYLIGIPILIWGAWQIYVGFIRGIDS